MSGRISILMAMAENKTPPTKKSAGPSRGAGRARPAAPARRRPPGPPPLVETPGPEPGTPLAAAKLAIGVIERPHGVHGEMRVRLTTDSPESFAKAKRLFLGDEETQRRVLGVRFHQDNALLRLEGITTPEEVRTLSGTPIRTFASEVKPLAEGEYFYFQLIGINVVDETGESLGTLTDILETGANDVYVVSPPDGKETILLPNIPSVILNIDLEAQTMMVRLPLYA